MAWKSRPNGRRYYYQSIRVPGQPKPVSVYLGRGEAADQAADLVVANRRRRDAARRLANELIAEFADADQLATDLHSWGGTLLAAAMTQAGYRKHRRESE